MNRILVSCFAAATLIVAQPAFAQTPTPEKLAKDYVCGMSTAFLVVGLSSVSPTTATANQSRETLMFFTAGLRGWALALKEIPWPAQSAYSKKVLALATTLEKQSGAYFQGIATKGPLSSDETQALLKPVGQAITAVLSDPAFGGKCNNGTAVDTLLGGQPTAQIAPQPTATAVVINAPVTVSASAPIIVSGTGRQATAFFNLQPGIVMIRGVYKGTSNFMADLVDSSGRDIGSAANEIGDSDTSRYVQIRSAGKYLLNVTSEGDWTFTLTQPKDTTAPKNNKFIGQLTQVTPLFWLDKGLVIVKSAQSSGRSNFMIDLVSLSDGGTSGVANEIGVSNASRATQIRQSGVYFFSVIADGDWTIEIQSPS